MLDLFPKLKTPYLVWAPSWLEESSGARALHYLCHALNEMGQRAYMIQINQVYYLNYRLRTPLFTEAENNFYEHHGINPIVIYPDIVEGNPLSSRKVVRWLLAPRGKYGGSTTFPETDKVYGYTKDIDENVLCLPTFDEAIYYPPKDDQTRSGACYYAHKYDRIHGNKLLPLTESMTRCEGSPEQIANILRSHEKCYIYERSEIAVTALLCGCAIESVVTDYFDGVFPEEFFYDNDHLVPQVLLRNRFEKQLVKFIEDTQVWQ